MDWIYKTFNLYNVEMQEIGSYYGYQYCIFYGGLKVHYNREKNTGDITDTLLDMSGTGCRTAEELTDHKIDWFEVVHHYDKEIRSHDVHIARLDIACDVLDDTVDLAKLKRYTYRDQYVCRSKSAPVIMSKGEECIIFGSGSSDRRLRIYDKALEQKIEGKWTRLEFQLRNDSALSFYLNWISHRDIGELYRGIMMDYLRYLEVPTGHTVEEYRESRNIGRLNTARWWDKFLDGADRIKQLYLPGQEYTLERLQSYVYRQTSSSVKTLLAATGGDLGNYLDHVQNAQLNAKQRDLIGRSEHTK